MKGPPNLPGELRSSIINLGVIFGGYSCFVLVAGGCALYPLANHAQIDTVHEAGKVLVNAFPSGLEALGPLLFSAGFMIAAFTTFVVVVQVVCHFWLDMFGRNWHDRKDNPAFKRLVIVWVMVPAVLAPFWDFPALLKVLLLMGSNAIVIPLVIVIVLIHVNKRSLMGPNRAALLHNVVLLLALGLSAWLMVEKLPDYIALIES